MLQTPNGIENHVVGYFNSLSSSTNECIDNGLMRFFLPLFLMQDNELHKHIPFLEKVKLAVLKLKVNLAHGLDGFGAFFLSNFLGNHRRGHLQSDLVVFPYELVTS